MIEFDTTAAASGMQVVCSFGVNDMGMNIRKIIRNMMPKKKKICIGIKQIIFAY